MDLYVVSIATLAELSATKLMICQLRLIWHIQFLVRYM